MADKQKPHGEKRSRLIVRRVLGALMLLTGLMLTSFSIPSEVGEPGPYGVWVKAKSITSQRLVDEVLDRAEAGGFRVVFVNVFYEGQAYYRSSLVQKSERVKLDFDPLAYMVPEAHRRGIEVHAWFMVGKAGDEESSPILNNHPDWAQVSLDGEPIYWLNFNRPDVREFLRRLVTEVAVKYNVDGVHLDYTRYPGSNWSFDPYTIKDFKAKTGIDLDRLRFTGLPAFGTLEGNPLVRPASAQVLAEFSNGLPAVTLNEYGEGKVLLINWDATERDIAAGGAILDQGVRYLLGPGGRVVLLRSQVNAAKYDLDSYDKVGKWLHHLGWEFEIAGDDEIIDLDTRSVLVLPNVYIIAAPTANALQGFVKNGGDIIFIDGPTPSMYLPSLRAITGMSARGRYFHQPLMINPLVDHPILPEKSWDTSIEVYQKWNLTWNEYRQQGITQTVREIYRSVKNLRRDITVSLTITSDIEEADNRFMQDWRAWLDENTVDLLIPRGYADTAKELSSIIGEWKLVTKEFPGKIQIGLSAYLGSDQSTNGKPTHQMVSEILAVLAAGFDNFVIFSLESMSDEQLNELKANFSTTE